MNDKEFILQFVKSNEDKFIKSKVVTLLMSESDNNGNHYEIHFREGGYPIMHISSKEDLLSVSEIVQKFCDEINVELVIEK